VDVNQVVITITDGTTTNNLIYAANEKTYTDVMTDFVATNTAAQNRVAMLTGGDITKFFTVDKIRDEDASFSQGNPIMNTGDLITVYIGSVDSGATGYTNVGSDTTTGLDKSGLSLVTRTAVSILLTPESGAATVADFMAPSSYGVKESVALYP